MATVTSYFDRNPSAAVRPGLAHLQADPSSPHTPNRAISSTFSSPSASYRTEEEPLVFEFGARHFSAGYAGEAAPRCRMGFGKEESRRVGDYRHWLPGYEERKRVAKKLDEWGLEAELWRMDLRGVDLGLVGDRIERAVREAYTKNLLLDAKTRRVAVILPSMMPHPLLSAVLGTLFSNFQPPTITMLSTPVLSTVAAGCRSALIVDIGWREAVVTAVYEYREVYQARTTRAMRMVTLEMARIMEHYDRDLQWQALKTLNQLSEEEKTSTLLSVDLDQAEEVTTRMAWCKSRQQALSPPPEPTTEAPPDPPTPIPSPSSPRTSITLPFSQFASPTESTLFAPPLQPHPFDDNEYPLPHLLFTILLRLSPDVRATCMSRITITGGGAHIPGLKSRLFDELSALVHQRGWDAVEGKAADERRRRLKEGKTRRLSPANRPPKTVDPSQNLPAPDLPQLADPIAEKIRADRARDEKPTVLGEGVVRGVETLGAWAGGSLMAHLRVRGVVEVEREAFALGGLAGGARKEGEVREGVGRKNAGVGAGGGGGGGFGGVERGMGGLGIWG
ncbi:hypothetical protein MMC21_003259 [Puttea exsequens]|nr:hypothetical protein [Puttea exsequens]